MNIDKSKYRILRIIISGLVAFFLLKISALEQHNGGFADISPEQWPSFLAPAVTVFVAWMALGQYLVEIGYIANALKVELPTGRLYGFTLICGGAVAIFCYNLTFQHEWHGHLLWMALLFAIFLVWDICVLHLTNDVNHEYFIKQRDHIENGNILINLPSIFAVIILSIVLSNDWMFDGWVINAPNVELTPKDIFVSGVISFHLFVAALGYFFGAIAKEESENAYLKRLQKMLWGK